MKKNGVKIIITALMTLVVITTLIIVFESGRGAGKNTADKGRTVQNTSSKSGSDSEKEVAGGKPASGDAGAASGGGSSTSGTTTAARQNGGNADHNGAGGEPGKTPAEHLKNVKVHAVYLTGISAGNEKTIDHIVELSKTTELNAVVIDIKEAGKVNYKSAVPDVVKYDAFVSSYDPEAVIKKLHENNIYVIGRLVCFRDDILAQKRPELAIRRTNGSLYSENGMYWTNAYKEETRHYNIEIAKEAADKGFDEIQFDYVRFPSTRENEVAYGEGVPAKADAICSFLDAAEKELVKGKGIPISADVFGIICESPSDGERIGQVLERVGMYTDYISPMVYPSHFANASTGVMGNGVGQEINGVKFTAPDLKPYEVVYNTLIKGKTRISAVKGYKAGVRPYLQAFTATYIRSGYYQQYGAEQIRQQIKAVYDAGYDQWILWDPRNSYNETYFTKK